MKDELNFDDLTLIELPVSVKGVKYVLREASGDAAVRYRNKLLDGTTLGPEGNVVKVIGMANVEPFLVSLCLFDEKGRPVKCELIRSWPARIQKALFEKVKEISELDEEQDLDTLIKQQAEIDKKIRDLADKRDSAAKNALDAMEDGSN